MEFTKQRMPVSALEPLGKYHLADAVFPLFLAIASIWLFTLVLRKWKAEGPFRPSTPDLEKKPPVSTPGRKPGGMSSQARRTGY